MSSTLRSSRGKEGEQCHQSSPDSQFWSVETGGFETPGDDMGLVVQYGSTVVYCRTVLVVVCCTVLHYSTLCTTLQYCTVPGQDMDPVFHHVGTVQLYWTVLAYNTTLYYSTVLYYIRVVQ